MKWLLSLFGGSTYGYLIAFGIGSAIAVMATYSIVHTANQVEILALQKGIETKRANDNSASLQQLEKFITNIHIAQTNYQSTLDTIETNTKIAATGWKNATKIPLPRHCIPDPDRVRNVNAAISAANKATSASP